jgi:hypothetical protein
VQVDAHGLDSKAVGNRSGVAISRITALEALEIEGLRS